MNKKEQIEKLKVMEEKINELVDNCCCDKIFCDECPLNFICYASIFNKESDIKNIKELISTNSSLVIMIMKMNPRNDLNYCIFCGSNEEHSEECKYEKVVKEYIE